VYIIQYLNAMSRDEGGIHKKYTEKPGILVKSCGSVRSLIFLTD
jgi:hypothetical protein